MLKTIAPFFLLLSSYFKVKGLQIFKTFSHSTESMIMFQNMNKWNA